MKKGGAAKREQLPRRRSHKKASTNRAFLPKPSEEHKPRIAGAHKRLPAYFACSKRSGQLKIHVRVLMH
jgi:hypothetical protein